MKDPELLRKIRHLEKKLADKDAMIKSMSDTIWKAGDALDKIRKVEASVVADADRFLLDSETIDMLNMHHKQIQSILRNQSGGRSTSEGTRS